MTVGHLDERAHAAVSAAPQARRELAGAANGRGPGIPARSERDPAPNLTSSKSGSTRP